MAALGTGAMPRPASAHGNRDGSGAGHGYHCPSGECYNGGNGHGHTNPRSAGMKVKVLQKVLVDNTVYERGEEPDLPDEVAERVLGGPAAHCFTAVKPVKPAPAPKPAQSTDSTPAPDSGAQEAT